MRAIRKLRDRRDRRRGGNYQDMEMNANLASAFNDTDTQYEASFTSSPTTDSRNNTGFSDITSEDGEQWRTHRQSGIKIDTNVQRSASMKSRITSVPFDNDFPEAEPTEDKGFSGSTTTPKSEVSSFFATDVEAGCPNFYCPPRKVLHTTRLPWTSWIILFSAIYGFVLGTLFLAISVSSPSWSKIIKPGSTGYTSPKVVIGLLPWIARSIEAAVLYCYITFVGQVLSRRAIADDSCGMSISGISMREWISQPGMLLTSPKQYLGGLRTRLGWASLFVGLTCYFFTTAAVNFVSPTLTLGPARTQVMFGQVETTYANPAYISSHCATPITAEEDPEYSSSNCIEMEHAGQAYHNFLAYLNTWAGISKNGTGTVTSMPSRPPPTANLYDNVTVLGSWVQTEYSNMTLADVAYDRIINNVTMTMPHSGLYAAARDTRNGIDQPSGPTGEGGYQITATVLGPTVNVMCVNMNSREIAPLVYTEWPHSKYSNVHGDHRLIKDLAHWETSSSWPKTHAYGNSTRVDGIFGWGKRYDRPAPTFPMLPLDYNTVMAKPNYTGDSMYLLAKSASSNDYTVCSLRSYLSSACSTNYTASAAGGILASHCNGNASVADGPVVYSSDWVNEATDLLITLALNGGVNDGNSSNARLLTQLIPTEPSLDPLKPSIAEALAVQAGCTLLLGAVGSPFNLSDVRNVYQGFKAIIRVEEYISNANREWWQIPFDQVLYFQPMIALFLLTYFIWVFFFSKEKGLVIDYTEPQKLFAVAVNSPPNRLLAESCAGGPEGKQLYVRWYIHEAPESGHVYIDGEPKLRAKETKRNGRQHVGSFATFATRRKVDEKL